MRSSGNTQKANADLNNIQLDNLLDHNRHELFQLAGRIDWHRFEATFGRFYKPVGWPAVYSRRVTMPIGALCP